MGHVEGTELDPLPIGLTESLDEHGEQTDGARRVLQEEGPELVAGQHPHVDLIERDDRARTGVAVLRDRGQLPEELARAAEAQHQLAPVDGRGHHLHAAVDDEEHRVAAVAFEQHGRAAAVVAGDAEPVKGT